MSIYRQVWLAAIASMALALCGALLASMLGARDYLGSQLTLKNHDNAVALALMLSMDAPDPVKTTLLVASLFDSGHSEEIRLLDPQGATLTQRKSAPAASQAPAWFVDLLPITVASGQAKITSGWTEVGSVQLRSDSRFAHQALWDTAVQTALAAAAAMTRAAMDDFMNWCLPEVIRRESIIPPRAQSPRLPGNAADTLQISAKLLC